MPTIKERILNSERLTVVCSGDSHTWGQCAQGQTEVMPDAQPGELRRLPDNIPCYTAMFGRYLQEIRGPHKETKIINSGIGNTPITRYYKEFSRRAS